MHDDTTTTEPAVRFKGAPIRFGDRTLIVPALSLRSALKLQNVLSKMQDAPGTSADLLGVAELAHEALKRNYPDMSIDDVLDGLDLDNMQSVIVAMIGGAGTQAPIAT